MRASSDFADWLSPMLVKELRQGLRARVFVLSFLFLQAAMIFMVIYGLTLVFDEENTSSMTGFFWIIIGVPLLFIMPTSGLGMISREKQANTLELIFLTRLNARRIIVGKWLALVAQTLLYACAVLPYVLLRYFLGAINLGTELLVLGLLLVSSAVLSAVTVSVSPHANRLTRGLFGLVGFIGFYALVLAIDIGPHGAFRHGISWEWPAVVAAGALLILLVALMLEVGASKIAPVAENHSTPKRLLTFTAIGVAAISNLFTSDSQPVWIAAMVIAVAASIDAMIEPPQLLPSIIQPFVRRGVPGRLAGRILCPGWQSGAWFAVVCWFLFVGYSQTRSSGPLFGRDDMIWHDACLLGAIVFPVAVHRVFFQRSKHIGGIYFGVQVVSIVVLIMASLMDSISRHSNFNFFAAIFPLNALLIAIFDSDANKAPLFLLPTTITGLSLLAITLKARPVWREISRLAKPVSREKSEHDSGITA